MSQVLFSDPILGNIQQTEIVEHFPIIDINHPDCQAKLSLYGGQVLHWQPAGQEPVFWLSNTSSYQQGKAIRGGIPICWPWFGPLEGTNQHGFARTETWQLSDLLVTEEAVVIEISWQGADMDKQWPYHAKVTQQLSFGKTFQQTFTIKNLSSESFSYTGALHSYFVVSNPENVTVPALDNVAFMDKLTGKKIDNLTRVNCIGPIDTVYDSNQPQVIIDTGLKRNIFIETEHTQHWVLWNPGKTIADTMADVHPNGEQEYVCLEAANTEAQVVAAGETVSFSQTIKVKQL